MQRGPLGINMCDVRDVDGNVERRSGDWISDDVLGCEVGCERGPWDIHNDKRETKGGARRRGKAGVEDSEKMIVHGETTTYLTFSEVL